MLFNQDIILSCCDIIQHLELGAPVGCGPI